MLNDVIKKCINDFNINCAVVVKNLNTGEEAKVNEQMVMPAASIIKLFVMCEVFNNINKGKLFLEDKIIVKEEQKISYQLLTLFDEDREFTIRELLKLMICQSENTATNILIDMVGIDNINFFIKSLGFKNCEIQRKMLDMEARMQGKENYISATEVSKFLELLYNGEVINEKCSKFMIDIMKSQLLVAEVHRYIPDNIGLALKTGDVWGYKHAAGIFYIDNCDYVFTMLINYKDDEIKFMDEFMGKMSAAVYNYFKNN
ncbi:hypothetical protein SDC9_129968 [bioreactor metagenome]|uniref:Beta-lactamase class A catalytic domain-containing protein n=1 Tax=bioreactor metagenome TaxID=1076179 RepID=A0A645D0F9_9ZZZZ